MRFFLISGHHRPSVSISKSKIIVFLVVVVVVAAAAFVHNIKTQRKRPELFQHGEMMKAYFIPQRLLKASELISQINE